jgi:hypothetical protein
VYRQARFFIRTALVYLLLASLAGAALLINQGLAIDGRIAAWQPVFYHLLMVGWATQLIGGVALWMLPPYSRDKPRGNEALGWGAYVALNAGLVLRVVGEPLLAWGVQGLPSALLAVSAIAQVIGVWLLVFALWPRVKGRGRTPLPSRQGTR